MVITVDGYKQPVEKPITILTEKKAPNIVLSSDSAVIYPAAGIVSAQVEILDKSNYQIIEAEDITVSIRNVRGKEITAYDIQKNQNKVNFVRKDSNFNAKVRADITINKTGNKIKVNGPTELVGKKVAATDLRAGACLILAGLKAKGTTTITDIEHVLRGYENIIEKLQNVGAKIEIKEI